LIPKDICGFVTFESRKSAEEALECTYQGFQIRDLRLTPLWAKSRIRSRPKPLPPTAGEKRKPEPLSKTQTAQLSAPKP